MPRALVLAVTLHLAASVSALAQPRYRESPEPPLADGSVQQAGGQIPVRPILPANYATPVVTVDVVAPSFVQNGKDIELKLRVENPAAIAATDVYVSYQLPKGGLLKKAEPKEKDESGVLTWSIGTLAGGAKKEISLTVAPGPDMTEWNHVAKVRFEHGRQGKTKIARPEVSVKVTGPSTVQQHDIVSLRLEVSNPGLMEIYDVMVADNLPDGLVHQYDAPPPGQPADAKNSPQLRMWTIPRLSPNEVRAFDFRVLADKAGEHNQLITASNGQGAKHDSQSKLKVVAPKLELSVDGPAKRGSHQTATFRVTVRNAGNAPLRNITVSDKIPAGCDVVTASEGGQSFDRDIQWILPILQPNESRVLELTTKVSNAGPVQQIFAASYRGLREQKQVVTNFEQTAALRMEVQPEKQAIIVGDTVRLTITVENFGSAQAFNVRPTVLLPTSLTYVSAEPATHRHDGGRVAFDAGTLAAGGRQTFSIAVKATRAALPAVVTVDLESDQLESGKLRREESVAISDPRRNDK
jgi:uncharacterized repeat protein (TIGR01451 family)